MHCIVCINCEFDQLSCLVRWGWLGKAALAGGAGLAGAAGNLAGKAAQGIWEHIPDPEQRKKSLEGLEQHASNDAGQAAGAAGNVVVVRNAGGAMNHTGQGGGAAGNMVSNAANVAGIAAVAAAGGEAAVLV